MMLTVVGLVCQLKITFDSYRFYTERHSNSSFFENLLKIFRIKPMKISKNQIFYEDFSKIWYQSSEILEDLYS